MFAALCYDSTGLALDGMKQNGPTSEGIRKFLSDVKDYDGVTGKLSFNKDNDVVRQGGSASTSLRSRTANTSR